MPDARRSRRWLAPTAVAIAVGAAGAWLGLAAAGRATYRLGPFEVSLQARPGSGLTEVALPPLGEIRADTHAAPIRLTATLERVDPDLLNDRVADAGVEGLSAVVEAEGLTAVRTHTVRSAIVAVLGATLASLVVHRRRWGAVGVSLAAGLALTVILGAVTFLGYRPEAFVEPTYTGSLRLAPDLIGPIRTAGRRIEVLREELQRLVRGTVEAYGAVTAGEGPSEDALVVLHISDVHSSPLGMDFAQQLATTFRADLVVDTGDLTSFGTRLERPVIERIPQFGVPYLFVRGNHDSIDVGSQVESFDAAETLESELSEAAGLTVFGAAHPLFTPEEDLDDEEIVDAVEEAGADLAERMSGLERPPDIVLVHDPRMAEALAGRVPLVLSGHFHRFAARIQDGTAFLETASTGGGGLDTFLEDDPLPLAAQILYLEGSPARLVAVDRVALEPDTRDLAVRRLLKETIGDRSDEPVPAPSSPAGARPGDRR
jgi:predicted phosphodiesterase